MYVDECQSIPVQVQDCLSTPNSTILKCGKHHSKSPTPHLGLSNVSSVNHLELTAVRQGQPDVSRPNAPITNYITKIRVPI